MKRLVSLALIIMIASSCFAIAINAPGVYRDNDSKSNVPPPNQENTRYAPHPTGGDLRVDIRTRHPRFHVGDTLPIFFSVNHRAYIWIFNTSPDGRTVQVYPNYFDRQNCIEPGSTYEIPDDSYQINTVGPRGTNRLDIVAVRDDHPISDRWRSYTHDDPYPAVYGGAKEMMNELSHPGTGMKHPSIKAIRHSDNDTFASNSCTYYVMENVGDTPEYRQPRYGKIAVNSYPTNGRIYIKGCYQGRTPQMLDPISAGEHTITVLKEGYEPYECTVTVYPGRTAQIDAFLKATPVEPGYRVQKRFPLFRVK
ncbi:DUF4384 domain-containing protein [Candidatus Sumerlaeota bacterium]|nr:PEGA domain-containing protein [Candidatus Sumerlaeales bacterium]NLD62061.1 DUF4384 domain-containing protein [Candidatus Sumerlaeota bacterium]